ncbi:MAG TPA: antibiotic biosynthesis monooxygenase [Actinophytocola sp.]|uniref:antibiotic biosynthesis monooxygenase n=1 Tax=Actinophytocola sp. TaxID=1872138 RepID=UPI002DBC70F3|nr:antibiotic biosynthesis monooxygenase [Actinophytocola sp.]HEU5472965.1 antibiotic biosynthesis monooxygenase [Actinophytocola sp.]
MPFISPDDGYLTLFNIFETATVEDQDRVLDAMRDIVDGADYPGWISSTVHTAEDHPGTANYIQWRSLADLEARYAGEKFKKKTVPLFQRLSTMVQLLKTELAFVQCHPEAGAVPEISVQRDDFTVITVLGVEPANQKALVDALAQPEQWRFAVPGYRSHAYFRVLEGHAVVGYSQWDDRESYDRFHAVPDDDLPVEIQKSRIRARSLITSRTSNTYRVWHSRSAVS